jgi:probable phosphoglycerate mutase
MRLRAWFDGGARGNPGPAGFGVVVRDGEDREIVHRWGYLGRATNNVAEYSGLIAALEEVLALGATEAELFTDSELLQRQLTGVYKVRQPHLRELYGEAQRLAARLRQMRIVHVPRARNRDADALANRAMDEAGSGREPDR